MDSWRRGNARPSIEAGKARVLAAVADFVTRARSGVVRDGHKRELEYAPEPEAPTRFAKVLYALASGIAVARDQDDVTDRELATVLRVALDCLPIIRRRVIGALVQGVIADSDGALATRAIANAAQFSTPAIRRALEDLQALGLVTCCKAESRGEADTWVLVERWATVFRTLSKAAEASGNEGVSEKSVPPSPLLAAEHSPEPPHANGHAATGTNGFVSKRLAEEEEAAWTR